MIPNNQYWFNNKGSSVVPIPPSPLIQTWYNGLLVKPSNNLMTALNTLVDGLDADGNWDKLDLFGLLAGLETEEQRLKPLITTSGEDFVKIGNPTLNNNGGKNNASFGSDYLDLKWNPTDDGIQYTLNSAFISTYQGNFPINGFDIALGSLNSVAGSLTWLYLDATGGVQAFINTDQSDSVPTSFLAQANFYAAGVIHGGSLTSYANTITDTVAPTLPLILPTYDFFGLDANGEGTSIGAAGDSYFRHFMAGAGDANQAQIRSRLETFYTARGLAV
jgi:hypothetical protein